MRRYHASCMGTAGHVNGCPWAHSHDIGLKQSWSPTVIKEMGRHLVEEPRHVFRVWVSEDDRPPGTKLREPMIRPDPLP